MVRPITWEANNGANCNHSGPTGWDSALFSVESWIEVPIHRTLLRWYRRFPWKSQDLGNYGLAEDGELEIAYRVETDQRPADNPTNHSYFPTYLGTSPSSQ